MQIYDKESKSMIEEDINYVVPWYLCYVVAKMQYQTCLLSSECFGGICNIIDEMWTTLDHKHKDLIILPAALATAKLPKNIPPEVSTTVQHLINSIYGAEDGCIDRRRKLC